MCFFSLSFFFFLPFIFLHFMFLYLPSNNRMLTVPQCHVAAMVAASAASYNRSIMWRYLNTCSSCDNIVRDRSSNVSRNISMHHHHRHTRKPAIRHNKRCTFATTATISDTTGHRSDISGMYYMNTLTTIFSIFFFLNQLINWAAKHFGFWNSQFQYSGCWLPTFILIFLPILFFIRSFEPTQLKQLPYWVATALPPITMGSMIVKYDRNPSNPTKW